MQCRQSCWPSRSPYSSISASPCSSRNGSDMSDAGLIAILLAAFALAIGLVQLLGRLIDSGGQDGWAGEPPDTGGTRADGARSATSRCSSWGPSESGLPA